MYSDNTTCWIFLSIFYFQFVSGLDKNTGSTSRTSCRLEEECVLLKGCKSYMDFIEIAEKPLKQSVVEFLRGKQCGFHDGYPKVCCSSDSRDDAFKATTPKTNYKNCPMKSSCIPLKDCRPYMNFIGTMEKPLKSLVVEFLRAQQCGFQEGYPTVCCSLIPKNIKALKHGKLNSRPHKSTRKPLESIERIKEKAEAINKAFNLADFLFNM